MQRMLVTLSSYYDSEANTINVPNLWYTFTPSYPICTYNSASNTWTVKDEEIKKSIEFNADGKIIEIRDNTASTLGDVDNSGEINSTDAIMVLQHYAGISTLSDITCADVDKSNALDASDAILILQLYAGIIKNF